MVTHHNLEYVNSVSKYKQNYCYSVWNEFVVAFHGNHPAGYPIRYQSNNSINRITVVTNNLNITRIVASGFFIGFASRQQKLLFFF
jgi:hypothetical protein